MLTIAKLRSADHRLIQISRDPSNEHVLKLSGPGIEGLQTYSPCVTDIHAQGLWVTLLSTFVPIDKFTAAIEEVYSRDICYPSGSIKQFLDKYTELKTGVYQE